MSNRASATRPIVAAVCALLLIVLLLWTWHSFYKPSHAPDISREVPTNSALAAGRAPANIRSAVLYDCYEHARENVPPRNDTSARANNWQPPPMPLETARAAISDKKGADGALLEWLENWDTSYRAGKPILNQAKLISLLDRTRLGFEPLFNIGAAMGFLESKSIAAIFHRAALRRAAEDYKDLSPLHPAAPMLRIALPQMGMYWNNGDYELLEQRFKLEMQLYPPLSQEARKCTHSCAEAMFYQGKPAAADLMASKVQRDEQAGDLSASDKQEMGWIVGIFYREDRAKEAIAGLIVATQSGGGRGNDALQVLGYKLLSLTPAQMDEQMAVLEKKLSPEQFQKLQRYIEQARPQRAMLVNRPTTMTSAEAMAARGRAEIAASQPTTRRVLTTQQAAMLAARRAQLATTRPTTPTTAQINAARLQQQREIQLMRDQERAATENLVPEVRALLKSNPRQAIDRLLNRGGLQRLLQAQRYDEVEELAVAAIIVAARDTWQVEQLQRFRIGAFYSNGRSQAALSEARALFNVAGMGSVPSNLATIANSLTTANPSNPALANRFRLQQLAGAQPDAQRKEALDKLGENILNTITIDPAPFAQAIKERQNASDYDTLYALGNLLLVSGRIAEAREVFEKLYKIAPAGEINYASEAIAKVIKAEDGNIGRANEFAASIRPKE